MSNSPYIQAVDVENFEKVVIQSSFQVPVLVDFWAEWCAPCKALIPVLEKLVAEYQGQFILAKVNTDEQQELAMEYGIRSIPTLKLFRQGQMVEEMTGAQPESVLRTIIDRHRDRKADHLRFEAIELYRQGKVDQALLLLERAEHIEPDYFPVILDKAKMLLDQKRFAEVTQLLQNLPANVQTDPATEELQVQLNFAQVADRSPSVLQLRQILADNPLHYEARHQLGAQLVLAGEYPEALEQFLELMRQNRQFGEDAGRKSILGVFMLLGNSGELVSRYRSKMSSLLLA